MASVSRTILISVLAVVAGASVPGCLFEAGYHLSLSVRLLERAGPTDGNVSVEELSQQAPALLKALRLAEESGWGGVEGEGPVTDALTYLRLAVDKDAGHWVVGFEGNRFDIGQEAL